MDSRQNGSDGRGRADGADTGKNRRTYYQEHSDEATQRQLTRTSDVYPDSQAGSSRRERRERDPSSSARHVQGERRSERRSHRAHSRSPGYHQGRGRSRSPLHHSGDPLKSRRVQNQDRRRSTSRSRSIAPPGRSPKSHRLAHHDGKQCHRSRSRSSITRTQPSIPQELASNKTAVSISHRTSDPPQAQIKLKSESPDHLSQQKDEPNFQPSGKLAAETKTFQGVVLKYHEPSEARKPSKKWRLYVFKEEKQVDLFHIHHQSAYLFGRDRLVADVPIDHPSSSKQHAVIQFRQVSSTNEFGESKTTIKPFIIDLESANGTFVNQEKIPVSRYYELQSGDVIKFGFSTREFVLIPEV